VLRVSHSLNYTIGNGSSVTANLGSGLIINTSILVAPGTSFSLNDGASQTFSFFSIWTNETSVNPDDESFQAISATLNFSNPITGATVNGITFGGSLIIFQGGRVEWQTPSPVFTLSDRTFSVSLSDETFNVGIFGLSGGQGCGAWVQATITQISSTVTRPAAVPENGSTVVLLGVAACGLMLLGRNLSRTNR